MPLFYQQNINATTKMAIWAIEEPLAFFESTLQKREEEGKSIMHPVKRTQHLAARFLLQEMLPEVGISKIQYASNGKPYFENERVHFSISHCNGYAACVVSEKESVGIDIELISERVKKVAHKFLHSTEHEKINKLELNEQLAQLTICWAAKEAMYKMHEQLGIDFSEQLRIDQLPLFTKGNVPATILSEAIALEVEIHYERKENFVWAVCVS